MEASVMQSENTAIKSLQKSRTAIRNQYHGSEEEIINSLIQSIQLSEQERAGISARAAQLITSVRSTVEPALMENFLAEYGLSSREGVALMCLAEALLRVPDNTTIDDLIQDKIAPHQWSCHLGHSNSFLVNASTWGLMFTGKVLEQDNDGMIGTLRQLVRKLGEPVIRLAISQAMKEMGSQFVLGRNIHDAYQRGLKMQQRGYTYSFDMLGEAAMTEEDAQKYYGAYAHAIIALTPFCTHHQIRNNPGISVKLSALYPRYEITQRDEAVSVLAARTLQLAIAAKSANMGFNIDAEEANRLDMSLDIIQQVLENPALEGWDGFGIVVQAYGKRAAPTIDWLYALAQQTNRKIMIRLVKGAYWDSEIKKAQVENHTDYPVFTRKCNTDVSYLACAQKLLSMRDRIYPQFATHNAHTLAAIKHMAGDDLESYEFQRLHGMGETLYAILENESTQGRESKSRCRIYAPVGEHKDLLAYLVRRLLENGANSSFVHQIVNKQIPAENIAQDPIAEALAHSEAYNNSLALPSELFGKNRINSKGWNIASENTLDDIRLHMVPFLYPHQWNYAGETLSSDATLTESNQRIHSSVNPANPNEQVGRVIYASNEDATQAITQAVAEFEHWSNVPVATRAALLKKAADLFEENALEFFALLQREAGKTLNDAISEVREAVDFLRYYAQEAKYAENQTQARGVIVCISPWNFPLAIFTGQIVAALVTGNTVVAKPAEPTPLIAQKAVELLHQAGIPEMALQLLQGRGRELGNVLVSDARIKGICFTGSTQTAQHIEKTLANNESSEVIFIAETGGLNAMIADSSALPEQVVRDVVASAFQSAGQRCSALRVLFVQKDVEAKIMTMITGAMDQLKLGNPINLTTDVGPVIDQNAKSKIENHILQMQQQGKLIKTIEIPEMTGHFCGPTLIRLNHISELKQEIFGPCLHVISYDFQDLDQILQSINQTGYGLTFAVHSRIDGRVQSIIDKVNVGNYYVNRNQIGAVVGSQPFGGTGLSGTGPKAGGPLYLRKFRQSNISEESYVNATQTQVKALSNAISEVALQQAYYQLKNRSKINHHDRLSCIKKILKGEAKDVMEAVQQLDFNAQELPGPTGESNQYALTPRGLVICLGTHPEILLAQVVQALVAGNSVIAVLSEESKTVEKMLTQISKSNNSLILLKGTLTYEQLQKLPHISAVALKGSEQLQKSVQVILSQRAETEALVTLIHEIINPVAYVHEKVISMDTTAAGGNAQLLAEMS